MLLGAVQDARGLPDDPGRPDVLQDPAYDRNFDMGLDTVVDHFSRPLQLCATPHAPCDMLCFWSPSSSSHAGWCLQPDVVPHTCMTHPLLCPMHVFTLTLTYSLTYITPTGSHPPTHPPTCNPMLCPIHVILTPGPLVGIAQVKFAVSPAPPSQCFTVTGMLGDRFPAVCAAGGVVTVSVPTNGTASGPIYLVSSQ